MSSSFFFLIWFQTFQAGIQLVNNTADYALISDSARLEMIAAYDCQFKVITPVEGNSDEIGTDFQIEYAIGFHENSPFLQQFDIALEQLELSGKLSALIDQHWINYCSPKNDKSSSDDGQSSGDDEETNGASNLTPSLWLGSLVIATLMIIHMLTTNTCCLRTTTSVVRSY